MTESVGSGQVLVVLASARLGCTAESAPPAIAPAIGSMVAPAAAPDKMPFSQLFTEHFRYVYNTLRRLGVHGNDLEDSTHDVFLAVYRHLSEWDPARPVRPWLFAFAYRTASTHRRQARRRHEFTDSDLEALSTEPDPLERLVEARQLVLVQNALLAVALEQRAVFILHELDETPMPETAQALGIPLNTGYSRLRTARRKFDAALERLQQRGGK